MLHRSTRRAFAAAPFFIRHLLSAPPSSRVRLAAFGAGGMAFANIRGLTAHPKVRLACVAEVDSARLRQLKEGSYGEYRVHEDWRVMLDKERKNADIACVGTPDHMHAPNVMGAFERGLPVYGQKPLAHDIFECRRLAIAARKKKLVTQMGIQVHSSAEYKQAVAVVQSGAIGKVKEVHSWSEKKWGDPAPLPERSDPVPATLNWDLWLGVCAPRPYLDKLYHPGQWRKRLDFGTATFGDMGCHILDPVFSALALGAPLTVRSEGAAPGPHNWAVNTVIHYRFPGTAHTAEKTIDLHWYDGDERPPAEVQQLIEGRPLPGQGSIFIGTKGVMLLAHVAPPALFPAAQYRDYVPPTVEAADHYKEFVEAVLGNGRTSTPFSYSGPLTEAILLGPVATRFPRTTLEWNAGKLRFRNSPEATRFVRREYRAGWRMKGLG